MIDEAAVTGFLVCAEEVIWAQKMVIPMWG